MAMPRLNITLRATQEAVTGPRLTNPPPTSIRATATTVVSRPISMAALPCHWCCSAANGDTMTANAAGIMPRTGSRATLRRTGRVAATSIPIRCRAANLGFSRDRVSLAGSGHRSSPGVPHRRRDSSPGQPHRKPRSRHRSSLGAPRRKRDSSPGQPRRKPRSRHRCSPGAPHRKRASSPGQRHPRPRSRHRRRPGALHRRRDSNPGQPRPEPLAGAAEQAAPGTVATGICVTARSG
jgi:hypothetical protein